ncbi:hypothetical protein WD374_004234 [Vibrio vulnificus]
MQKLGNGVGCPLTGRYMQVPKLIEYCMKKKYWFISVSILVIFIPIGLYSFNFGVGLWQDPNDWGSLGSYLSGIYSPVLSFGTLLILWSQFQRQKETEKENMELDIARRRFEFSVNVLERLKIMESEIRSGFENFSELDSSSKNPVEKIYDIYFDWVCGHVIAIRKPGSSQMPMTLAGKDKITSSFELYILCLDQLKQSSGNVEVAEIYRQAKLLGHTYYYSQLLKKADAKKEHFY